ncbi:hypothetical protein GCM10025876_33070 [Demequina litorisediminis]|uniref:Amidohydrolase family protein n=1 Tax=Demequina litorisediminis TaxID=1849022 RepID=A0ABQ6IGW6_9MICO|nr:hypothetical protein GCM10025876_33070 [Demequina litorisediminis]
MPIHGEVRHLLANGKLAMKTGVPEANVMFAENGVAVDLKDGVAKVVGAVEVHNVYVDGSSVGEITDTEPEGPPHPVGGGLRVRLRGGRLVQRHGRVRPRGSCPRPRGRRFGVRRDPAQD